MQDANDIRQKFTLADIQAKKVPFETYLWEVSGVVRKVFPREGRPNFYHQVISIAADRNAEPVTVRIYDRDEFPASIQGSSICFRSGVRAQKSVLWEQIVTNDQPTGRGRLAVRKAAEIAIGSTPATSAASTNAARSAQPTPTTDAQSDVSTRVLRALSLADNISASLANSSLAYLVSDDARKWNTVLAIANMVFGSGSPLPIAADDPFAGRPALAQLACLIKQKPDGAIAIETLATFKGFLREGQTWRDLSEPQVTQLLPLLERPAA